jgi:voltage-gated potassium channel Kch
MDGSAEGPRAARYVERRIERKGLRPRVAASIIAGLWVIAIVLFGILVRLVDPDSFENVWLGMWWATQTVTTVGYGDYVPAQAGGQIIGVVLMVGGLSFFAVITGVITSAFVTASQDRRRASGQDPLVQKLERIAADVDAMRAELTRLGNDKD